MVWRAEGFPYSKIRLNVSYYNTIQLASGLNYKMESKIYLFIYLIFFFSLLIECQAPSQTHEK